MAGQFIAKWGCMRGSAYAYERATAFRALSGKGRLFTPMTTEPGCQNRTVVILSVDVRVGAGLKVSKGHITSPLTVRGDDPFSPHSLPLEQASALS